MKFLKKLLMVLLVLSILFGLFVFLYTTRPDLIETAAGFLHPDQKQTTAGERNEEEGNDAGSRNLSGEPENQADAQMQAGSMELQTQDQPQTQEPAFASEDGLSESIRPEYIPPEQSEIIIPESVSGRNGYQQIQEEGEQVEEADAEILESQLGPGETGDGLIFDAAFYPYYEMLDDKGKHLYRQIYANANALNQAFSPVEQVMASQLKNVFMAVYNDHPELFWLETAYRCKYRRNGQCVEIDLQFNSTAWELEQAKSRFNENANAILNQVSGEMSNYEKERMVHDILIDRIDYDLRAPMNQSAYSAMVNGRTVCAGYARAFQYLLQQLGIPCYYCTGYAGENHAWNIVSLEDGFYNVDVTWDDTDGGNYDYFNQSDQDYADTHVRKELSVYLPPCNGQGYRNLEQAAEAVMMNEDSQDSLSDASGLRSLADVGMDETDILYTLSDYYDDCYNRITAAGRGTYKFSNVIEGGALFEEMQIAYQNDSYRAAYMDQAMETLFATSCEMSLTLEPLEQDRYLITHTIRMR